jgi:hypothetical protein
MDICENVNASLYSINTCSHGHMFLINFTNRKAFKIIMNIPHIPKENVTVSSSFLYVLA